MDSLNAKATRRLIFYLGALAAALYPPAARADFLTPDSIPQPPPAVGSANLTPIPSPSDLATNQYAGRGLLFPFTNRQSGVSIDTIGGTAAVTNLAGFHVWAPALWITDGLHRELELQYLSSLTIQLVKPGSTTPTTVSSVTVEILHLADWLPVELTAMDLNGNTVSDVTVLSGTGPHGGELLTVSAANINSVTIGHVATIGGVPGGDVPWGVAGIEFTASAAPEPGGLALAGVGTAAAFAGWVWRRRRTALAAFAT